MKRAIYFLTLLCLVFGCGKNAPKPETEQEIFDKLFHKIVYATYKDKRLFTFVPPVGKPIYDKHGQWIGRDTVGQHERDLEYETKRAAIEKDSLSLVIAVVNEGFFNEKTDLSKYRSPKFIFRHESEFHDDRMVDYRNWDKKYPKFAGAMRFSKISFNAAKTLGTLAVWYSCGGKCGIGYRVQVKKIKGKWIISEVEETSMA
jgi:hypothetical protein